MIKITYPITLYKDLEDQSFINVTIPNILGAYTCGEGYDDAIYMAKDLLKLMIESAPSQCYPPESIKEIQNKWPNRTVENITIEVSDEIYKNYKEKMVPESDHITITVLLKENEETKEVEILYPEMDIEDPFIAKDMDEAVEHAEMVIKTTIKADISRIHGPIYSQGELRLLYPLYSPLGISVPISTKNKNIIQSNYPLIEEAIKSKDEHILVEAFDVCFFKRRNFHYKLLSIQLIKVYEEMEDKSFFIHLMEELYIKLNHRISEEFLVELPLPFLLTLKEYVLMNKFLEKDTRDPLDPYIAYLKGVCFFYLKEYEESKKHLLLASKTEAYQKEANKYLVKLEKKEMR